MSVARFLAVTAATITVAAVGMPTAIAAQPDNVGKKIVVFKDSVADPGTVAKEHGNKYGASVSHVYGSALKGYAASIPNSKLAAIANDARVLFVGEDREVSISAQTVPTGIDRMNAELSSQLSGDGSGSVSGFSVAVIDTGSGPHPDLNIAGGKNCANGKTYADGDGHGTHVAGTIGAKDDGNGVVGVAPGVPIYSVRVLNNKGSGSFSTIACGIDWVTANAKTLNIRVANMSLGGPGSDDGNCGNTNRDALHKAICRSVAAGVTYVVAAGNDNQNMAGYVPASYNEVLTVTAASDFDGLPGGHAASTCRTDVDETAADFSNYTTPGHADAAHTIAAPGVCINSTWKGGGYDSISGTSMASPHVAGLAALCLSSGGCGGTPAQIRSELLRSAATQPASYGFVGDAFAPLDGRFYGHMAYAGGY